MSTASVAESRHKVLVIRCSGVDRPCADLFHVIRQQGDFETEIASGLDCERAREGFAVVVLAAAAGETDAIDRALEALRAGAPRVPILVAADSGGEPEVVYRWFRAGAWDFLSPPYAPAGVLPRLWKLLRVPAEREHAIARVRERVGLARLLGQDPRFVELVQQLPLVARSNANVLIRGETGTGKELVARSIHHLSSRTAEPFVAVSCAGIPDALADNELWGHAKGAYTGASTRQRGLVAEADGGTLLLDDVDRLSPVTQAKLLRFLQEREYRMLGSPKLHKADVRVLASTNLDLLDEVRAGHFRLDLYHRLNVVPVDIPPLRERGEDIPLLATHFAARFASELGIPTPLIPPVTMRALLSYEWPGNVRELMHVMERAIVLSRGPMLSPMNLMIPDRCGPAGPPSFQEAKAVVIRRFERAYLERQLSVHAGNVSQAARASGKHRRAFFELIRKHGIDADRYRS